jgi:hypothetical protein
MTKADTIVKVRTLLRADERTVPNTLILELLSRGCSPEQVVEEIRKLIYRR